MSTSHEKILEQALNLLLAERATLVDQLVSSLDKRDSELDAIWAREVEARIEGAERSEMKSIPSANVFGKYNW